MEIIIAIISIIATSIIWCIFYNFKSKQIFEKGKQKGSDDFLRLLLLNGYNAKIKAFHMQNKYNIKGGTVFVGDSITQDYNVYEYFTECNVYNRGIGGDTTVGLLKRLQVSIYDLNPKCIVLLIGINDFSLLNATEYDVFNNINKIINQIKLSLPNVKIILQSIYPVSKAGNPQINLLSVGNRDNKIIDRTNNLLKTIKGVVYVDVNSLLKDAEGNLNLEYTVEGLHLNETGYHKVTGILKEYIR